MAKIPVLKGRGAAVGDVHHWADGDYRKTPQGWKKIESDIKRELDFHNKRKELSSYAVDEHQEMVIRLKERIQKLEAKAKKRPDVKQFKEEISETRKELYRHAIRAQSSNRAEDSKQAYLESISDYLKDHKESYIRLKHDPAVQKLQNELDTWEPEGENHTNILDKHLEKVGEDYDTDIDARKAAEVEIAEERQAVIDRMDALDDTIDAKVRQAHEEIDDRLAQADQVSESEVSRAVFAQVAKMRGKGEEAKTRLRDPYARIKDVVKEIRSAKTTKSSITSIIKARFRKYFKREPTGNPERPWRYFYSEADYKKAKGEETDPNLNREIYKYNPELLRYIEGLYGKKETVGPDQKLEAEKAIQRTQQNVSNIEGVPSPDQVEQIQSEIKNSEFIEPAKAAALTEIDRSTPENLVNIPDPSGEKFDISRDEEAKVGSILSQELKVINFDDISEEAAGQIRKNYDPEVVQRLADTILSNGLQQPIEVRPDKDNPGKYKIVAGHTRFRAIQKLLKEGKVNETAMRVIVSDIDEKTKDIKQLIENEVRKNNSALEVSDHYAKLVNDHGMTPKEVADLVGLKTTQVNDYLKIQNLDPDLRNMLKRGEINKTTAIILGGIESKAMQTRAFSKMIQSNWKTHQLRAYASALKDQGDFFSNQDLRSPAQKSAEEILEKEGKNTDALMGNFQKVIDKHRDFIGKFLDKDGVRLSTMAATATGNYDGSVKQLEHLQNEIDRVLRMMKEHHGKMNSGDNLFKSQMIFQLRSLMKEYEKISR